MVKVVLHLCRYRCSPMFDLDIGAFLRFLGSKEGGGQTKRAAIRG